MKRRRAVVVQGPDPREQMRAFVRSVVAETLTQQQPSPSLQLPPAPGRPVLELAAEWAASMQGSRDDLTAKGYHRYARALWAPRWATVDEISTEAAAAYMRDRLRVVRKVTVKKEMSALRGFLAYAEEIGAIPKAPVIAGPPKRATGTADVSKPHRRGATPLSPAEVEAILERVPERSRRLSRGIGSFVLRDFFVALYATSLRPATLEALRVPEHYQRGAECLTITDPIDKARYGRRLPLTPRARAALDRCAPDEGLIFGPHSRRYALRKAARAVLPYERAIHVVPYDLRHAFGTHTVEKTANLAGVAYCMGHRLISTTAIYVHGSERAAREVLGLDPVAAPELLLPPVDPDREPPLDTEGAAAVLGMAVGTFRQKCRDLPHTFDGEGRQIYQCEDLEAWATATDWRPRPHPTERPSHGVRARYVAGCRCEPCRQANREYDAARYRRLRAAGKTRDEASGSYHRTERRLNASAPTP